jgi:type I restriction enzyme M protein
MSEEQKKQLEKQLWNIANELRGKMNADAYEYLIGQFASGAGKKAVEFYTPQQVSIVLAKLVTSGKTKLKSVLWNIYSNLYDGV